MRYQSSNGAGLYYGYTATPKADPSHFESHCHDDYELLYVRQGNGRYVVEGAEYPLRSHTLILIRPYEYHYVRPDKNSVYERYVFNFDQDILLDSATELPFLHGSFGNRHGIYFSEEYLSPLIREEFTTIKEVDRLAKNQKSNCKTYGILLQATLTKILLLLSLATPFDGIKYQENMITRVTEYLDQHTAEELSLDKLAQQFFVSKYYLCHAFRQQNGISVFSYLTAKRIAMAQQLMLKGESATSAAYRVGFRNHSSFYRAYLKQTGQAPIQCKKTIHKQEQS